MKKSLFILLLCGAFALLQAQQIPSQITYCGINITLTPGAQERLATYVAGIYESPRYYNAMVQRAYTFMPFIEEALKKGKVPEDLKYLAIQESSLKGDAVSSSNAVGYWQFKEPVAQELGLRMDRQIDERRHIYQASVAAAKYLKKANEDFDNWVYAVIAYYEGLTGAVTYTNPDFYGKREMQIDENLHWYVMKAIAHKLAYQDALSMEHTPQVWLKPHVASRGVSLSDLSEQHGMSSETILEYNPWILDGRRLPSQPLTYYVPHFDTPYPGHTFDPIASANQPTGEGQVAENQLPPLENSEAQPIEPEPTRPVRPAILNNSLLGPPAQPAEARDDQDYAVFKLTRDIHYGSEFVMVEPGDYLNSIADRYDISLVKLLLYNDLRASRMPPVGTVLYLNKKKKVLFHIVEPNENLGSIAAKYGKSIKKLQKLNHMDKEDKVIYVGQKLHVKKKKDKEERLIILDKGLSETPPEETTPAGGQPDKPQSEDSWLIEDEEIINDPDDNISLPGASAGPAGGTPPQGTGAGTEGDSSDGDGEEVYEGPSTEWVVHTVAPGETLWKISKAYGTKVEIIKLVNKLETDSISPGAQLRILANKGKMEKQGNER